MNWAGLLLGASGALALGGGLLAVVVRRPGDAVRALALAMLGVAGTLFALGSNFAALAMLLLLGTGVPAASLAALASRPDEGRTTRSSRAAAAALIGAASLGLLWRVMVTAQWPAVGGPREIGPAWTGFRLLTENLLALVFLAALLAVAALGALATATAHVAPGGEAGGPERSGDESGAGRAA